MLRIIQGGAGGFTITWPTQGTSANNIGWVNQTPILLSTVAGGVDIVSFLYNGSYYEATYGNNFG
jgi:hypothetical protein